MASTADSSSAETFAPVSLPRISIEFCTQCKWMLRAAYFAQELLSTFSTSLGEVSLIPSTGGVFTVDIVYAPTVHLEETTENIAAEVRTQTRTLWDRKTEGSFPETKELKKRVRDIIDPTRDLGHVDGKKKSVPSSSADGRANGVSGIGTGVGGGSQGAEAKGEAEGKYGAKEEARGDLPRNLDGSVCEDCN